MASSEVIGIIGGAGVAASAELIARLERYVTASGCDRDACHPEILMHQATKVPSRSMFLEGRGESFVPGYIDSAKKLKQGGATFIAMCCNTAHYAHREIEEGAGIPVIDLIAESIAQAHKHGRRIGLLCSDGTRKAGIYEKAAGQPLLMPGEVTQAMLTRGICNIKKGYHRDLAEGMPERPATLFRAAYDDVVAQGAEVVILGCTEIPLDFAKVDGPVVDTIEVLAQTCLARWRNGHAA